ncbi:MAG: aspartate carbamoyltransferase [Ezakiella sp.]|nr:aspartate carbamoyltransferase [Ezakiella sp.]MDD7471484.1 aspartate carbamoyltransferase [Bacillota bacterium]MDY3923686.1 aspartate carbamoyltransferase [Ezakiella sp.]
MLKGRNFIEPTNFSLEELDEVMNLAAAIKSNPEDYLDVCKGKLLATLFYEPSTRTRFSFEAAMLRLGGSVIGFSEPGSSSVAKGESLRDTIRTVGSYSDIIVMRHPKEGAPNFAQEFTYVPLINAGDGGHQHPTQTLTDLFTIRESKGRLDNLTIGLCGDLKFGRTVHSLIKAMSKHTAIRFILISPPELQVPTYFKATVLDGNNLEYEEYVKLEDVIPELDILYMTRVQKERFFNEADYVRLKDSYVLDANKLKLAKEDLAVLHPLPRVTEIANEVDDDPRAWYFRQVKNGMFVRMALIMKLLGVERNA